MTKPELESRVKHLERQRSRWYTAASSRRKWFVGSLIGNAALAILLLSMLVFRPVASVDVEPIKTEPIKVEFSHPTGKPQFAKYAPNHIASVVRMHNGCSGVVVCQGPNGCLVLTAEHCLDGKNATFRNPTDGSTFTGRLIAKDERLDVAMFRCEPKSVASCWLASSPSGTWDAAGYTAGGGIKYKSVIRCPNGSSGHYHVTSGPFGGGDSGGGVFAGGRLVGVISRCEKDNRRTDNQLIYPGC